MAFCTLCGKQLTEGQACNCMASAPPLKKENGGVIGKLMKIIAAVLFCATLFMAGGTACSMLELLDSRVDYAAGGLSAFSAFMCALLLSCILYALGEMIDKKKKD